MAPLLVVSVVLLAHSRIQGISGEPYALQTYILYLQLSLALLFALSYGLAIWNRRSVARHSRFMVCTALTLVDPVDDPDPVLDRSDSATGIISG